MCNVRKFFLTWYSIFNLKHSTSVQPFQITCKSLSLYNLRSKYHRSVNYSVQSVNSALLLHPQHVAKQLTKDTDAGTGVLICEATMIAVHANRLSVVQPTWRVLNWVKSIHGIGSPVSGGYGIQCGGSTPCHPSSSSISPLVLDCKFCWFLLLRNDRKNSTSNRLCHVTKHLTIMHMSTVKKNENFSSYGQRRS